MPTAASYYREAITLYRGDLHAGTDDSAVVERERLNELASDSSVVDGTHAVRVVLHDRSRVREGLAEPSAFAHHRLEHRVWKCVPHLFHAVFRLLRAVVSGSDDRADGERWIHL